MSENMLSAVHDYISRGWAPIPIPHRGKGPRIEAWQNLRINAETAPSHFNGTRQNVGIILGKASGGLTDLDLDCPEAIAAAPYILPKTAIFGRASKPASHWIYCTKLSATQDRAAIKFLGSDKTGLLEIRMGAGGAGAQTVFPPSTHVSGEAIEWVGPGPSEIADVDGDDILQSAHRLAAAAELARNYPKIGGRHDAAFVLGGFLARCEFSPAEASLFVEAVGAASLQPGDKRRDMARTARNGANAEKRAGFPMLAETFGKGAAKKVAEWLDYNGEDGAIAKGCNIDDAAGDPRLVTVKGVQVRPNGEAQVHSFAHGGARYRLVHDVESIAAAIEAAPEADAAKVLAKLIVQSDVGRDEADRLCKLAGARAGCGSRIAAKMVAEAKAEQREAAARERRRLNALASTKARLPVPLPDAEAKPIMEQWDDILANAAAPPMRDVEGWPVMVELREIAGLHELTASGSNDAEDEKTRLPSPKTYLLTKHNRFSLEIELSDHITFYEETKDGDRAVGAPFRLLTHWLEYKRSTLPIVRAVVTMPLVLASGEMLAGEGLDRGRGVYFQIDPSLAKYIPERSACTPIAVAKAYTYLADEWLVDVAADRDGKAVLIALALSIIERVLFPERPAFNVTAGLRGNGKTTAISMVLLAALGVKPPAMAWTHDGEERRKALYAVLREGAPLLVFDNIPRGTIIACSHIERALTTDVYRDRVLGESESPTAPAFTIIVFTGNNIGVKSDMASRVLIARLTANRTDPENRPFTHDDPVAWTLDHRGDILNALYTVLLGNPRFDDRARCAPKTRFKTWWHLVGSAVENAVQEATKTTLSFEKILKDAEAGDEEAAARGAILKTLHSIDWQTWDGDGDRCFTTADLAEHLGKIADKVKTGVDESDMAELRRFCTSRKATAPTPTAITRALNAIAETPTAVETAVLTLHAWRDTHAHASTFKVVHAREA